MEITQAQKQFSTSFHLSEIQLQHKTYDLHDQLDWTIKQNV